MPPSARCPGSRRGEREGEREKQADRCPPPRSPASQFELAQPPNDAISALAFAPGSPTRLLASSWDKHVYLYDTQGESEAGHGSLIRTFEHGAPVMDVCFGADDNEAFSAGMDWQVKRIDLESGEQTVLGKHSAPVRRVVYSREHCAYISFFPSFFLSLFLACLLALPTTSRRTRLTLI